jgi:hypothetical protein
MNGGRFQNYKPSDYWKLNESKSRPNPLADSRNLNVARDQLGNNPLALPPLAVV